MSDPKNPNETTPPVTDSAPPAPPAPDQKKQTKMTAADKETKMVAGEKKIKVRLLQDARIGQDAHGQPKGTVVEVSEEEAKNLLRPRLIPYDWYGERHGDAAKQQSKVTLAELVA